MADADVQAHIETLVAEEHELLGAHQSDGLNAQEHARLEAVKVELDQLWDLLRQRRALREAGQDPDGASERSGPVVEDYLG